VPAHFFDLREAYHLRRIAVYGIDELDRVTTLVADPVILRLRILCQWRKTLSGGVEAVVKTHKKPSRLPVDVHAALEAIAGTGKGRCWYCDVRLPDAAKALGDGWDVQRIDEHPVASIILVCPECLLREGQDTQLPVPMLNAARNGNGHRRPVLALAPKQA
jgi:hypothetical protein